jgi:hypothetical protein
MDIAQRCSIALLSSSGPKVKNEEAVVDERFAWVSWVSSAKHASVVTTCAREAQHRTSGAATAMPSISTTYPRHLAFSLCFFFYYKRIP